MTERSRSEAAADEQFSVTSGADQGTSPGTSSSSSYTAPDLSYGSTSGTSTSATDQAKQAVQGATDQAKQAVQGATDQAKQVASDVAGQAREQATSQLSNQKERAASSLSGVADALRQTGQQLDQNDQAAVGKYVSQAADQVERFQGYLKNQDVGAIVNDIERMAREQPVMFLGSAFVLGILGARFLKSSGQGGRSGSSYGSSRGYTSSGYGGGSGSRGSTYGPAGTTSGTSYGATSSAGYSSSGSTSYGATRTEASDSDFLASSLTTGSTGEYSPAYGTGLAGTETSDKTSMGDLGGTSTSGRSRESGSTEEA